MTNYKLDVRTPSTRWWAILLIAGFFLSGPSAIGAGPADEAAMRNAWNLYNQQKYAAASDAFDALIRTASPNARLYYYAALANRAGNRMARAKQLTQYIITNFPSATEASYARNLFSGAQASPSTESASVVPASMKGKTAQELLQTEAGRKVIEECLARKEALLVAAAARGAEASRVSAMVARSKGGKNGERVFSASDIASDGAGGIDQMYYPNCWFESSMSALAMLPRGQKLMADMIRHGDKEGNYVVRFPGDGVEYKITEETLEKTGIHDKALWATLIECAQTVKFPNDAGGQLADGLGYLTGHRAETMNTASSSEGDLSSFIDSAVKTQNPIVCGSQFYSLPDMPRLVVSAHAYTIVGFDMGSGMVKIRNPHGANSQRFSLNSDPNHHQFEQLDDGVFRMHISLFKQYFSQVAKANI
jgi:hypothetical protein